MKQIVKLLAVSSFLLLGATWLSTPSSAQKIVRKRTDTTRLDLSRFTIARRTPIPFKPYEMKDAKTGRLLDPNRIIKSPTGKDITIKQYFDELNRQEKGFN